MTKRKTQRYVVRCKKAISGNKALLASRYQYKKGDLVSPEGTPTRRLASAAVYDKEHSFPFKDIFTWGTLEEFFEAVPVTLTLTYS